MSLEHLNQVKGVKCSFLEYESIKEKSMRCMHIVRLMENLDRLDKITLKGKGCKRRYKTIQQIAENVINDIRL